MFGHRSDGYLIRKIDPIITLMPHIMTERHDSQNMTQYDCPCEPLDDFIRKEAEKGEKYNYMHIVIASIVRLIALFPRTNRFIMNGRIYNRNCIQISFVVKKGLSAEAPDTTVKLDFTGHESISQVRDMIDAEIKKNSHMDANNGTDKLARLITFTPNFLIRFLVGTIKFLDRHGLLPGSIIKVSPFHTSCFITNLKSIKGPSIFHHLYDFGNTGMFFSMGKEAMVPVVQGKEIVVGKRLPLWIVTDERFCDGFYFVSALKQLRILLADPSRMAEPLETLAEDTKVVDKHSFRK